MALSPAWALWCPVWIPKLLWSSEFLLPCWFQRLPSPVLERWLAPWAQGVTGLALSEHVEEPRKEEAVRSAAGEADRPSPRRRDRYACPSCGSGICWGFPTGEVEGRGAGWQGGTVSSPSPSGISMLRTLFLPAWIGGAQAAARKRGVCPRPAGPGGVGDPPGQAKSVRCQAAAPLARPGCMRVAVCGRVCAVGAAGSALPAASLLPGVTTVLPKPLKKLCSQVE